MTKNIVCQIIKNNLRISLFHHLFEDLHFLKGDASNKFHVYCKMSEAYVVFFMTSVGYPVG